MMKIRQTSAVSSHWMGITVSLRGLMRRRCHAWAMLHEVETNVGKSVFRDYSDGKKQTSALFGRRVFS